MYIGAKFCPHKQLAAILLQIPPVKDPGICLPCPAYAMQRCLMTSLVQVCGVVTLSIRSFLINYAKNISSKVQRVDFILSNLYLISFSFANLSDQLYFAVVIRKISISTNCAQPCNAKIMSLHIPSLGAHFIKR
jgi:hypothetical protein